MKIKLKEFINSRRLCGASLLVICLCACSHHHNHSDHEGEEHHDEEQAEHKAANHDEHGDETVLNHEALESAGLKFETTQRGEFHEVYKCAGVIENSRGGERVIVAPATGIVTFGTGIVDGASVKNGQSIFHISSQNTEQADNLISADVEKDLAAKELKRAESLIKDNLISKQEYDRIKADYEKALKNSQSIGARNRTGMNIASPMNGALTGITVKPGSFVNMGDVLATVVADRRLVLRAEVSEKGSGILSNLTGATFKRAGDTEALDLECANFKVLSSQAVGDVTSHFIPVYIEFDNPGGVSNGNVVEVWLKGARKEGVLTVPVSAVIEDGGIKFVYVEEEPGIFHKHEVKLGTNDGHRVEILSGLPEGEKVVTEGALRIKLAGMASTIPGHSHHH